jgi:Integral membrane protein S linking to the trans Golgi network
VAHLTLHHFFDWRWFSFSTFTGWMVVFAHTFNAFAAAAYMMVVVRTSCCCHTALLTAAPARLPDCRHRASIRQRLLCRSSGQRSASTLR